MIKISRRSMLRTSTAVLAAASSAKFARADVTSYTPADLKSTLTPFGALRAGNEDGSIPAWTGGYATVPAGYQPGDPRPVPFADEKPLFVITAQNYTQYQTKLSKGTIALLQKYPDYRLEIYPTHRTAIAPQYVYDYIYKNASTAQLSADGNSISGAYGGIPFPIPTNGHQVLWNHELAWTGTTTQFVGDGWTVTADGQPVFETRANVWYQYPYYFEGGEARFNGFFFQQFITPTAPPYEAGASILSLQPLNPIITPVEAWEYLAGERRVRRAPELQYDTPNSLSGGVTNWDELDIFSGKLDRYDLTYTGVIELYVPYNTNKAMTAAPAQQYLKQFFNPDFTRWELHRVRVVEMTVKAGARNVDARRTIYCDEDTGAALMGDVYDASGALWKAQHVMPVILPDVPCVQAAIFFITYDLHAGNYSGGAAVNADTQPQWKVIAELQQGFFTPGHLAASAGGF